MITAGGVRPRPGRAQGPAPTTTFVFYCILFILGTVLTGACNGNNTSIADAGDTSTEDESPCPWDDDDEHGKANALGLESVAEGYICPRGDQDWYTLTVPAGSDLLSVALSIDAPLSALNLTYSIWSGDGVTSLEAPTAKEEATTSEPLLIVHGLAPGNYLLSVRDRADDAEDVRHAYQLTVSGSKDSDTAEPNGSMEEATAASGSMQGYISFRGDEDWYRVEAQSGELIRVDLTMPAGGIDPAYRILDPGGDEIVSDANQGGKTNPTALSYLQAVETAGTYYVVISDDEKLDYDTDTAYTLQLSVEQDPDQNEGNDHPSLATELAPLTAGADWSESSTSQGYIGSSGDIDWFKVDLQNTGNAVLEVEVTFDSSGSLPENLQASTRLIREVEGEPCSIDQDCHQLSRTCEFDLDCSRVGNTCLINEGVCAGGSVCLPSGNCAALLLAESAPVVEPPAANRNEVHVAAPLFGTTTIFIAVEDFHADTYSLNNQYTLNTRVRTDPDGREASEAYTAGPPEADDEASHHTVFAKEITVHDCTAGADCCGPDTWVSGYLSYSYDQDWFRYSHPCPGQDCILQIHLEFDSGPVDFHLQVYDDDNFWYDTVVDIVEQENHPATSDHFGGLGADDKCFYGFAGHVSDGEDPFWYHLAIRDTIYVSEGQEENGSWDWSTDQAYRFCIETLAIGCQAPCQVWDDGCGPPLDE